MSGFSINGKMLHYEALNKSRRNTPVLFIHGEIGDWSIWFPLMQLLESHRCYSLDLWGFGYSTPTTNPPTLNDYVEQVLDFIETIGLPKVIIVGHGIGAIVADQVARRCSKVEKVVFVGLSVDDRGKYRPKKISIIQRLINRLQRKPEYQHPILSSVINDVASLDISKLGDYPRRSLSIHTGRECQLKLRALGVTTVAFSKGDETLPMLNGVLPKMHRVIHSFLTENSVEVKDEWHRRVR